MKNYYYALYRLQTSFDGCPREILLEYSVTAGLRNDIRPFYSHAENLVRTLYVMYSSAISKQL